MGVARRRNQSNASTKAMNCTIGILGNWAEGTMGQRKSLKTIGRNSGTETNGRLIMVRGEIEGDHGKGSFFFFNV